MYFTCTDTKYKVMYTFQLLMVSGFRFQVKSLPSSEMLIGCVREWRKRNKRLLVRKGEDKDKDKRVSNSEV